MLKYVTKSLIDFPEKRRYWPSRALKRPPVLYNPTDYYASLEPSWEKDVDYGHLAHYEYASDELVAWRDTLVDNGIDTPASERGQ